MLYITRNGQDFGPYDEQTLQTYVNSGQILLCDQARDSSSGQVNSVKYFLKRANLKINIPHNGNLFSQLKDIGGELIFPKNTIFSKQWTKDKALVVLAVVGLLPTLLFFIPMGQWGSFYFISFYFSVIWGLFFYYIFKTSQVTLKTTALLFFSEQLFVFLVWGVGIPNLNPFYAFTNLVFPLDTIGYILGVGLTEELAKLLPLFIICSRAKQPLIPQTLVFYGLMCGIAFGVHEGVDYQLNVNISLEYTESFILNIARLTSLPFMHAIWCGIAGYFISFAKLYPKYRRSLFTLALCVPALLHGLYDTFASGNVIFTILAIAIAFVGVILLTTYLKQGVNYQSKLRN